MSAGFDVNMYITVGADGAMRVGRANVPIDSVLAAFHEGHSPESIRASYPALTLEEVYGAITYYLANRAEVDAYLERQDSLWADWRNKTSRADAPVIQRLRANRNGGTGPGRGSLRGAAVSRPRFRS